jgi:hypothetical protein
MGEASRRKKAAAAIASAKPDRLPDLGQHLWNAGMKDKPVYLVNADCRTVGEAPRDTRDVSFFMNYDNDTYVGTLNTRQTPAQIQRAVALGIPLVIEGELSKEIVTGQGGEDYRMILGRLTPMGLTA